MALCNFFGLYSPGQASLQQSEEQWPAEVDVIISLGSEDIPLEIGLSPSSQLAESETESSSSCIKSLLLPRQLCSLLFDADDDECASSDSSTSV